jgi:hypothetical protein
MILVIEFGHSIRLVRLITWHDIKQEEKALLPIGAFFLPLKR